MGVVINLAICYARMLPLPTYGQSPCRHLPLSRRSGVVQIRRAAGGVGNQQCAECGEKKGVCVVDLFRFRMSSKYAQPHKQ